MSDKRFDLGGGKAIYPDNPEAYAAELKRRKAEMEKAKENERILQTALKVKEPILGGNNAPNIDAELPRVDRNGNPIK